MRFVLLVCLLFIGTLSHAAETVMHCNNEGRTGGYTFKLVSSFLGKDKIYKREDGAWIDWCTVGSEIIFITPNKIQYEVRLGHELTMGDKGGKCEIKTEPTNIVYREDVGMHMTEIVDFYLQTFVIDTHKLIRDKDDVRKFKWEFTCKSIK